MKGRSLLSNSALFWLILKHFKKELVAVAFFSALVNVLMLTPTLYMLQVMDRVMLSQSEITLLVLSLVMIAFYSVQAFSEVVRSRIVIGVGLKFDSIVSNGLFQATFNRQLAAKKNNPHQSFEDLMMIRQWLTGQAVFSFFDLPWAPIYLFVMFLLHPVLGAVTILFMVILALFAWWTYIATRSLDDKAAEDGVELNTFIHDRLRHAEVIESHGVVGNLFERWWRRQKEHLINQDHAYVVGQRFTLTSKEIRSFMQSLAIGVGALLAINGEITVATMIAASLLIARATAPVDQIASGWRGFSTIKSAFIRLNHLLNEIDVSEEEKVDIGKLERISVYLEDVSAGVEGRSNPILNKINLTLLPGSISVLMGPAGAGKSTLARVIANVWPSVKGRICVNEFEASQIDRQSLGRSVGFLPQEVELFSGSVKENIARMGAADPEEIIKAAKLLQIHDMVLRLPMGYDTQIGESGGYLSGGQRQLLGLARALFETPKLIILDEPNSNLDEGGEKVLSEALLKMKESGATVVVVAHRPSLLNIADRVIILNGGSVVYDNPPPANRDDLKKYLINQSFPKYPD